MGLRNGIRGMLGACCRDTMKGSFYQSRWHGLLAATSSWVNQWDGCYFENARQLKRPNTNCCVESKAPGLRVRKSAGLQEENQGFLAGNNFNCHQLFSTKSTARTLSLAKTPWVNPWGRRIDFSRTSQTKGIFSSWPGRCSGMESLDGLVNYEELGVPKNAGSDGDQGFPLRRMQKLLDGLGNPQNNFKIVHVAGSKGKGSTCAFIAAILQASGFKVGLYTSPHIISVNERIHLNGGVGPPVSLQDLEELINIARPVVDSMKGAGDAPTYFEVLTAAAFKKFALEKVDIGVIEVGLGGGNDATNVFAPENVLVSVLTPIAHEHLDALGGTLESVAKAKAGIMKQGRPCITSHQEHEIVRGVLNEAAENSSCVLSVAGELESVEFLDRKLHPDGAHQEVRICTKGYHPEGDGPGDWSENVVMPFMGDHQAGNITVAIRVIFELSKQGWGITAGSIKQGLQRVKLLGRCQVFRPSADSPWLLLDGAHTKESAASMVESKNKLIPSKMVTALVIAMLEGKEHSQVMQALLKLEPQVVIFTTSLPFKGKRSTPPGTLVAHWEMAESGFRTASGAPFRCRKMIQASISSSLHRAIAEIESIPGEGLVCVTGSMYAVSEALGCLNQKNY